jgi:uncharacterized protein (TIGR02996 family)
MTERDALLAAVCEQPDDDTPRLVFADWLQENGEEARAEFIRLQIELVGTRDGKAKQKKQAREKELLAAHREDWEAPFRGFEVSGSFRRFVFNVHFRRGFVWGIDINDEDRRFAAHAAALFQLAPIERINFFHKGSHEDLTRCRELLRVKELSIDRAGFETEEIEVLLRSKFLANVTRLELIADDDNGHLAPEGIALLSRATTLPSLRHLDLSHNWCGWDNDNAWVEALTDGTLVKQLEFLSLRGTFLNDDGAETLADCKRLRSLTHLDLAVNTIGDRGLLALAASKNLPQLTTLDLRHNLYDTEDGVEVKGCTPDTRRVLEARFGAGVLIDGRLDA